MMNYCTVLFLNTCTGRPDKKSKARTAVERMCGLSTVVTPAGASLTMYREIRSYANSIWDDNNNNIAQRYHVTSDTLGREFDPGKRDYPH